MKRDRDRRRKLITVTSLNTGAIIEERYVFDGVLHREPREGPALVKRAEDGTTVFIGYYLDGRQHREDGPSRTEYWPDGSISSQIYSFFGKFHRDPDEGPAVVARIEQGGGVVLEKYCVYGKLFRDAAAGPCFIRRNPDGSVDEERYSPPDAKRPGPTPLMRQTIEARREPR